MQEVRLDEVPYTLTYPVDSGFGVLSPAFYVSEQDDERDASYMKVFGVLKSPQRKAEDKCSLNASLTEFLFKIATLKWVHCFLIHCFLQKEKPPGKHFPRWLTL